LNEVQVQANLFNALKHLRYESGASRFIWADALCINQEDTEERAQQVSIMREIYSCAEDVSIWLGEDDERTLHMLESIKRFTSAYEKDPKSFMEFQCQEVGKPHGEEQIGSIFYGSIGYLFDFPWFTRTWVLQEVFNARNATVLIGKESLPWELVMCVGNCMTKAKEMARGMGNSAIPDIFRSLFEVRAESNRMSVIKRCDKDILALFISALDLGVTDPRDKIFALTLLLKEADALHLGDEVQPDYNKRTAQVFANFTKWWIKQNQSLRILSTVHAAPGRTWQRMSVDPSPDLPDDRPSWSMWHTGSSSWAKGTLAYDLNCRYKACGSFVTGNTFLEIGSSGDILSLKGIQIGVIGGIHPYSWEIAQKSELGDMKNAFEEVFDPAGILKTWVPGGTTADPTRPNRDVQIIDHLIAHREQNAGIPFPCISPCLFSGESDTQEELAGLCPYSAKIGDIIVVLMGGNIPYLIRKRAIHISSQDKAVLYGFVGECFVHGYMHGRAIEQWREGLFRMETFDLT
jgi:hypothetical protein